MTEGERKNMKQDTLEGRAKTKNGVKRLCFSAVCILLEAAFIIAMITKLNQYAEIINLITRLLAGVLVLKLYASDQTSSMKMPWVILILVFPILGAIVQDLWDLNRSYESAVHALDYRFFFPHQNVFDGREALGHDLSATDFSDSREEELIRLLCKKDVSAIDSWFQDFSRWLTENFRTKSFTFIQICF